MRTRLTSRLSLLFLSFAVALLVFPAMAFAETVAPDGTTSTSLPTIQSDQADYPPGATVTLTGSNWQAGESVHINVNDTYGASWSRNVAVTADASGNISDSFNLPDYFVSDYDVTATGAQSGTVRTTFTDSPNPNTLTVSPSSAQVTQGNSVNYTATVGYGGNTTAPSCTISLSASGLPTGATASFAPSSRTSTSTADFNSVMTVSTTNATPTGTHTFTVQMTRGAGCQGNGNLTQQVTLVVNSGNQAPVANNDSLTTNEDTAGNVNVLANDTDANNDTLTVTGNTNPSHGTVSRSGGTFTYNPANNYNGSDSFNYTISDGKGGTATATVNISVTAVNDAPVAVDDSYNTNEDNPLTVAAPGVLGNDTDVDSANLTAAKVLNSGPSHGSVTLNPNGSFTYTPDANYNGPDSFKYTASDGTAQSNEATVSITVTAVNDAPTANAQSVSTNEDVAKAITLVGNDVEGSSLTYTIVTDPQHGTLSGTGDSRTYTPDNNYSGSDSFTFKVSDGSLDSNTATVSITVDAVNDAPVANNDSLTTDEDTAGNGNVLTNDTDVDSTTLTATKVTGPTHGTLTFNANGSYTYTPNANYNGPDSFTYNANDGSLDSNTATVSITVNSVNDAPVAQEDTKTTDEDTPLIFPSSDLVANDNKGAANESGQTLRVTAVSNATHGTVSLASEGGNITFTPATDFNGQATFDYRVCDNGSPNECSVETATVNVTVNAVNDAPVAVGDSYNTNEDTVLNVAVPGVLANDSDVDSANLTAVLVSSTSHGSVTLNANGSFSYNPANNYNGSDSFTYKANDGTDSSNVVTVSITVNSVNDAPSFTKGANQTVNEDSGPHSVTGWATNISAGPADENGQTLNFLVSNDNNSLFTTGGQPAVSTNGTLTYTLAANANGSATVSVKLHDNGATANDGDDTSATQTFTITINAVNDNPVIISVSNSGPISEGSSATITVNASDVDNPSGDLSYSFDCNNDSTFEKGPHAANNDSCAFNDEGTYQVNVRVTDGAGGSATDFTNVQVNNANPTIGPLTVSGSGTACNAGNNVNLSFSITDPGSADNISGTIYWGDGQSQTFTGRTVSESHTYAAGSYTVKVVANDGDGGTDTRFSDANAVSLRYNVSQLQDPVNSTGMTMSVFKYGSTVPLKVLITDCNNQPVNGLVPKISFNKVSSSTPNIGINEGLSTQPNDTNFLMRDAGNGQYIYNLSTKSLADGDATYNATITDSKATTTAPATYGPKVTQNFGLRSK
jgi:large repetitive protein